MNVNRMKKRILLLLLVVPALLKAQDVMTETRQELTSPDGAYRFTFYQSEFKKGSFSGTGFTQYGSAASGGEVAGEVF